MALVRVAGTGFDHDVSFSTAQVTGIVQYHEGCLDRSD